MAVAEYDSQSAVTFLQKSVKYPIKAADAELFGGIYLIRVRTFPYNNNNVFFFNLGFNFPLKGRDKNIIKCMRVL